MKALAYEELIEGLKKPINLIDKLNYLYDQSIIKHDEIINTMKEIKLLAEIAKELKLLIKEPKIEMTPEEAHIEEASVGLL